MKYEKPELKIVDFLSLDRLAYLDDQTKSASAGDVTDNPDASGGVETQRPPRV